MEHKNNRIVNEAIEIEKHPNNINTGDDATYLEDDAGRVTISAKIRPTHEQAAHSTNPANRCSHNRSQSYKN